MSTTFVSDNLGPQSLTRTEWLLHNTDLAQKTCIENDPNRLVLITDGTYLYCQKSLNNEFQKLYLFFYLNRVVCIYIGILISSATYSLYKKSHLVKPFIICASDGRIVDISGPYKAKENDEPLLKTILTTDQSINLLL